MWFLFYTYNSIYLYSTFSLKHLKKFIQDKRGQWFNLLDNFLDITPNLTKLLFITNYNINLLYKDFPALDNNSSRFLVIIPGFNSNPDKYTKYVMN